MTWLLWLAVVGLILIVVLRRAVRGFVADVIEPEQLLRRTQPIDVEAFSNLIRTEDDDYLRDHLPFYAFARVRRSRCLAARDYVRVIRQNSAILIRLAQTARSSEDARVSAAAEQLLQLALQTRVYALAAEAQLLAASLMPWWQPSLGVVVRAYPSTCSAVDRIVRLQRPEIAGRVHASLLA